MTRFVRGAAAALLGLFFAVVLAPQALAQTPSAGWRYYFTVASIGAATARIRELGGTVVREPQQVPGGAWNAQGLDPQGAAFALTSGNT